MNNIIEVKKVTKVFPGTVALDEVDFNLRKGEVHAVVGKNGAGKSTLMKILCGVYTKTSGSIIFNGEEIDLNNPSQAIDLGISIIYQELENIPKLTVAENVFLGRLPKYSKIFGFINSKLIIENTQNLLDKLQININPKTKVGDLKIAEQQLIEIAKSLSSDLQVLIMDEPTSYLTKSETDKLFKTIIDLKKQGIGIIYVSHRIQEVMDVSDRITILRDGKNIRTVNNDKNLDEEELIRLIIGHGITKQEKVQTERKDIVYEVKDLSIYKGLTNFSMKLYKGEILGIAGLIGSGKDKLIKSLFGIWPAQSKAFFIDSNKVTINVPKTAIKNGLVYLPEERKAFSLFPDLNCRENISPIWLHRIFKRIFLSKKKEISVINEYIKKLTIITPSSEQSIMYLSGGNQQKTMFARLLTINPRILLLHDPTRGIDVGSKEEIYKIIRELASKGASILILSSEIEEICNLSNRVLVLSRGKIIREFVDSEVETAKVFACATLS
jgi:ribose transport system ATP-binding protein